MTGWTTTKNYDILLQKDEMSCGLCCVGMIVKLLDGYTKYSESSLINKSRKLDSTSTGYTMAATNRVGAVATPFAGLKKGEATFAGTIGLNDGPSHSVDGTYGAHLAKLLVELGFEATYGQGNVNKAMNNVNKRKPLIVRVGEPGHWVVVAGKRSKNGDYIVLDPCMSREVTITKNSAHHSDTRSFTDFYVSCKRSTSIFKKVKVM